MLQQVAAHHSGVGDDQTRPRRSVEAVVNEDAQLLADAQCIDRLLDRSAQRRAEGLAALPDVFPLHAPARANDLRAPALLVAEGDVGVIPQEGLPRRPRQRQVPECTRQADQGQGLGFHVVHAADQLCCQHFDLVAVIQQTAGEVRQEPLRSARGAESLTADSHSHDGLRTRL